MESSRLLDLLQLVSKCVFVGDSGHRLHQMRTGGQFHCQTYLVDLCCTIDGGHDTICSYAIQQQQVAMLRM